MVLREMDYIRGRFTEDGYLQPYKRSVMSNKVPKPGKNQRQILMVLQARVVRAVVETITENTSGNIAETMCRRPVTLDLIH